MRIMTRSESKLLESIDTKVTMNDNDDEEKTEILPAVAETIELEKAGKSDDEQEPKGPKEGKVEDKKRKHNADLKMSERYNEEDANITIISSDGMAFKVHTLLLTRAS